MRTAVCLFGTIGGTEGKSGDKIGSKADVFNKAYPYYKNNLIEPNSADIFIHSWDVEIEKNVLDKYNPTLSKFESQKLFDIPDFMQKTQRVQNHFSRWYSCKKVLSFKKTYENKNNFEYDFVMLTRQDIAWQKTVDFSKYDNQYFYVPKWYHYNTSVPMGYPNGEYNKSLQDICFFSNSSYMNQISEIYDNISEFHKENSELSGYKGISNHRLLYYKLLKMGIIPDKLRFELRYDALIKSEIPLVRWLYYGGKV